MVLERIFQLQERKEAGMGDYRIDFCLYCEPDAIHTKSGHDSVWKEAFSQVPRGQKIELQYETRFDLGYWKNLKNISRGKVDGVHAPSKGRDIASQDENLRDWSLEETKRSMDIAADFGAKYFVLHLTPQDEFQDRDGQLERGFKSLEELTKYYKEKGYNFKFLLETLEHPKWPADKSEAETVLTKARRIFEKSGISEKLGFCLDVGHLWHNLNSLLPERKEFNFERELRDYMQAVSKLAPIEVIHLVGAYVEQKNCFGVNNKHETHAFPISRPDDFEGDWMDVDVVLRTIKKFSPPSGKKPIIMIEAHDPDIKSHLQSCQEIREQIRSI